MKKNELLKSGNQIIRVLGFRNDEVLVIDCMKVTMPQWIACAEIELYEMCSEEELLQVTNRTLLDVEILDAKSKRIMHERYTLIAGILPFVMDEQMRSVAINKVAEQGKLGKQSIRHYLCLYLVYQDVSVLVPKQKKQDLPLDQDAKNMRYALNRYFYNRNKNSLNTAYVLMLKDKYCDEKGRLLPEHPSIHQFRYYYRKHKKMQTFFISRDGLKHYQRNNRPLLGDGVREFAPNVGCFMADATVCDIYLVDDSGNLVGRPILTICVDAYSSLICGYSLSWEGGIYSLRGLMLNVITDKKEHCAKYGIFIEAEEWNCNQLPGVLVTDKGSEYKSETFEQIAELGIQVENLAAYRPDLKGSVEKAFDLITDLYKKHLRGKGTIEMDYRERGAHDYRRDARLTMVDFQKVLLHCIIYYNSKRIVDFPYTEEMLNNDVLPYANRIFEWGKSQMGANLISVKECDLIYTLLPRTTGRFTRYGLQVNGMRYKHNNYTEKYLKGENSVTVAYNPEDVTYVWLIENSCYIQFELIESRYKGKDITDVEEIKSKQKKVVAGEKERNLQAQIALAEHIQTIANPIMHKDNTNVKQIRKTRKREQEKAHKDYMKGGAING